MRVVASMKGVWKILGGVEVLRGIDLDVSEGEVIVVWGANGSGKTTLLRIMAGLMEPSRGEVRVVCGKACVGFMGHTPMLYPGLTVEENLKFFSSLYGVRLEDLTGSWAWRALGLEAFRRVEVRRLSYGWRRRADLARALVGRPKLLLADEPLTGMDAGAAEAVASILRSLAESGGAVVATTPKLDEGYMKLADRVLELRGGRLVEG